MERLWSNLKAHIITEKKEGYNAVTHNCCTVAMNACVEVFGKAVELLTGANKGIGTIFNICSVLCSGFLLSSPSCENISMPVINIEQVEL
jgi:hypothetical protein